MNRAVGFIVAALLAGSGCGDNFGPPAMTPDELLARLRDLPGVTVTPGEAPEHFSYYVLHFTQLLDHHDPSKGTFQQEVSLLHRDERAPSPLIVYTSGYWDDEHSTPVELTALLDANQVSIEHRFYGESRPDTIDWSLLTVDQAAADEHEIIQALHTIYEGAFLSVGESKGGITALFHRSLYPTDVSGTVAYVTPLSFNAPDPRYSAQFDNNPSGLPDDCRAAVRDLAMEMLAHRRKQMLAHAQTEADQGAATYTRVLIGPAVEAAIAGLEWGFWQTAGDGHCDTLPLPTDSDEKLFEFLKETSPVSDYNDEQLGYYEPYYYQSYAQLGYPDYSMSYLSDQMWYGEADYLGELPTAEPAFDPSAVDQLQTWLDHKETDEHDPVTRADLGKHILFLYGDWDPWFAGQIVTGDAKDSPTLVQKRGNHFTQLTTMDAGNQLPAFTYIKHWTGVEPLLWRVQHQVPSVVTPKLGKHRHPLVPAAHAHVAPR